MENNAAKNYQNITVKPEDTGMRLDVFLAQKLKEISRAQITAMIKAGFITIAEKTTKASFKVSPKDCITIKTFVKSSPVLLAPENIPLSFLYSDDHIAVINKPAGLVVHPGAGVKNGTLCNALLYHFPKLATDSIRPGIVHRLDKETSGVMVIAKSSFAHQVLSDSFKLREVHKVYRAFCCGEVAQMNLELKTGHIRHPYNRLKFFTKVHAPKSLSSKIRFAHTSVLVVAKAFGISELKITLHTGRTHQIRAHLADSDHPLLGDALYGGKNRSFPNQAPETLLQAIKLLPGQALHAESLTFPHPISKEILTFTAPLPSPLDLIAKSLKT